MEKITKVRKNVVLKIFEHPEIMWFRNIFRTSLRIPPGKIELSLAPFPFFPQGGPSAFSEQVLRRAVSRRR